MPVASMAKDPKKPLDPKKLTELCRTELTRIGIELSTVHRLSKLDTNRLGVGIMLYLQTYEYKLREHCHLDEAAINFMCHRMMQSVQADYYRCFVDDSARHYLSTALARCHRGEKVYRRKKNEQIVSNLEDDTEYITVYPSSDLDVASVILTFKTKDEPIIDINCVGGCRYHAQRLTA